MSFKESAETVVITSTINAHEYQGILDNFHITSIENWLGDDELI